MSSDALPYPGFRGTNYSAAFVEGILVVSAGPDTPLDADYDRYCAMLTAHQLEMKAQLVFTNGGAPNAVQRQKALGSVGEAFMKVSPPTAVLTDSAIVRGVLTLFNWFMPRSMKPFKPGDYAGAAAHIKVSDELMGRLREVEQRIRPPK